MNKFIIIVLVLSLFRRRSGMKMGNVKFLGVSFNWFIKPSFYYLPFHLSMTTRFMEANACNSICIGFLLINIWAKIDGWDISKV